jgi:hypothetical protein
MNEISFDLFAASALWLGAGVSVTLAAGVNHFVDVVTRGYIARRGRLPSWPFLVLMFVWTVLFWPKTFAVLAGMSRR